MSDKKTRSINPIRIIIAGIIFLVILGGSIALLIAVVRLEPQSTNTFTDISSNTGNWINPPRSVGNFTLTGIDGTDLSLNNLKGNYTLMTFGYTHCPDVCPLNLTEFKRVKRELGEQAERVNFVFVTVDGNRDTPDVLNTYLQRFDPDFIGMTTTDKTEIDSMTEAFSVYYEIRRVEETQAEYMVDHSATTFLLNPNGRMIAIYSFGTPPKEIAEDLQGLF